MTDFQIPRLHLISDSGICDLNRFQDVAKMAVDGGVDAIHVREKMVAAKVLLMLVRSLRSRVSDRALLFVNDRVDVALVSGADGVQLGERSLSLSLVRPLVGNQLLLGRSIHDAADARRAESDGADFVIAGHVYATASKKGEQGRGLGFIERVAKACSIPVIAIGGITPERVPEVLNAGAHGVAVISGILSSTDPAEAARRYRAALENGT